MLLKALMTSQPSPELTYGSLAAAAASSSDGGGGESGESLRRRLNIPLIMPVDFSGGSSTVDVTDCSSGVEPNTDLKLKLFEPALSGFGVTGIGGSDDWRGVVLLVSGADSPASSLSSCGACFCDRPNMLNIELRFAPSTSVVGA